MEMQKVSFGPKKVCQCCGKTHTKIPTDARPQTDISGEKVIGYFWECACRSTMFLRTELD